MSLKKYRKLFIPLDKVPLGRLRVQHRRLLTRYSPFQYPDYNFIGLIIGPRGKTHREMESETGAKVKLCVVLYL